MKTKFEQIDLTQISEKGKKVLLAIKKQTKNFTEVTEGQRNVFNKLYDKIKQTKPEAIKPTKSKAKKSTKRKVTGKQGVFMKLAKSIRDKNPNLTWKQAQAKASAELKESREKETKKLNSEIEKFVKNNKEYQKAFGSGTSNLQKDAKQPAKKIGKRVSKNGKTYYEYRRNRTDVSPQGFPMLEKGGKLNTFGIENESVSDHLYKADQHLRSVGSKLYENSNPKEPQFRNEYMRFNDSIDDIFTRRELSELDYAKGGKIDTSKKGVYVYELKDGTFKVANNYGGRDFPYEFADVFPTKERAMKFANKVAENSKSKVEVIKFEKGGKTQGYNDKLDESLGMRKRKKVIRKQSYKDRRDESKGMEKSMGRRAYQSVGTMDKMAKGGAIKGRNNKTGESFGVVIGSMKYTDEDKDRVQVDVRSGYSSRISERQLVFNTKGNLIETTNYGYTLDGTLPKRGSGQGKSINASNKKETIDALVDLGYNKGFANKLIDAVKDEEFAKGGKVSANDITKVIEKKKLKGMDLPIFKVIGGKVTHYPMGSKLEPIKKAEYIRAKSPQEASEKYTQIHNNMVMSSELDDDRWVAIHLAKDGFAKGGMIDDIIVIHTSMKPENFIKKHKLSNYEYEIDESDYDGHNRINFETYPKSQDFLKDKSIKEFYYESFDDFKKGGKVKKDYTEFYEKGGKISMPKEIKEKFFEEDGTPKNDEKTYRELFEYSQKLPDTKSKHYNTQTGKYSKSRQKLHKEIINEFKDDAVCIERDEPIAILMGGSPASGKSTFLRSYAPFLLKDEILRIDADEVRGMLPEYEGWNSDSTHRETKDIVETLLSDKTIGIPCKTDIIYDGTMNNVKRYTPLVKFLKKQGYKVFVVYIDNVPKKEIEERIRGRYKRSGRYVPLEVVDDFFQKGKKALNVIKKEADGYMIVDGGSKNYKVIEKGGFKIPTDRKYSKLGTPLKKRIKRN